MTVAANSKVTLAGSGVLLHVQNPSGESIPVQGTVDGAINTAGGGGGGGTVDQGAAGASSWKVVEDNSANIKTAVETLATNSPALVTGRVPIDGSGVTQPVSLSSLPALATGANTIGSAIVQSGAKGASTSAVVTSSPVSADVEALHVSIAEIVNGTIPVEPSGAWPVDQGAKQLDPAQAWYTVTTSADGLNIATVKAPSTTAVAADPALVVRCIQAPTTAVTGTVTADIRVASAAVTNANPVPVVNQNFATFNVIALATALGNGKAMISIMLVSGGSVTRLRLLDVQLMNVQQTNVTGILADFQLRRITAHSGGSDITNVVTKNDTADTLDAGITVRTGATVTTEANPLRKWLFATDEYTVGNLETEAFQASQENTFPNFFFDPRMRPLVARVNEGFQILCNSNSTAGTFDVGLTFSQE